MVIKKSTQTSTGFFRWSPGYIVLYIFLFIVLIVILKIISIKREYSPIFSWWNGNGGVVYNKFINLFSIMSSYDNIVFYWFTTLFGTLQSKIDRAGIDFLTERIFPLISSTLPDNENMSYFVKPRHVARDIRLSSADGDRWFNDFLTNSKYYYINPKTKVAYPYDENISLSYDIDNTDPKNPIYTRKVVGGKVGIYPSSLAYKDWQNLFSDWGVSKWTNEKGAADFVVPDTSFVDPVTKKGYGVEWLDMEKHPDNFFARYGIMPDSPLLIGFVNNAYNDPRTGLRLDPTAFANLIGATPLGNAGGWVGYLNGMYNSSMSKDDYINYLYSQYYTLKPASASKGRTSQCDTAGNIIGGITTGLGIAAMAAFLTNPFGWAAAAFVIVGIAVGAAQGINAQSQCSKS